MRITWKQGRSLPVFIKGGAMGLVAGAPVYAAGCTFPWRETEQAWYWDAERADWFPVEPSLPLGRCYTHGASLEDGLLLVGGRKSRGSTRVSLRDAWWLRRNGGSFSWTALPEMNYPRAIASVAVVGRKALVMGGGEWETSQGGAFASRHLANYELLDLDDLNTGWRDMGPLPFPSLVGSAVASVGDSAYVFGGYECWTEDERRRLQTYATAWRYHFPTNQWTRLEDLPGPASGWCAAAHGDQVVLMGGGITTPLMGGGVPHHTYYQVEKGSSRERWVGAYSDLVFVYSVARNSYSLLDTRLPCGLNDLRCVILGNQIYAAGGETVDPALSNCSNALMIGTIEE